MNFFHKDGKVIENKIEKLLQQEWETNENYENDEVKKKISNILSKFLEGQWRIYLYGFIFIELWLWIFNRNKKYFKNLFFLFPNALMLNLFSWSQYFDFLKMGRNKTFFGHKSLHI